jgi:hypothetical protein
MHGLFRTDITSRHVIRNKDLRKNSERIVSHFGVTETSEVLNFLRRLGLENETANVTVTGTIAH